MIYLIWKLFKKQLLKYYYLEQSFKKKDLKKCFVDSNGTQYHTFIDRYDIPLARFKEIEKRVMMLQYSLSDANIDLFCNAMETAINKGRTPDVAKIGHLINELRKRKEILLHPEILFELVALLYIREDEDPSKVDENILKEKIAQFEKDSSGGLYDFFYLAGLNTYIPYLEDLKDDFSEMITMSTIKLKAIQQQMESFTVSK